MTCTEKKAINLLKTSWENKYWYNKISWPQLRRHWIDSPTKASLELPWLFSRDRLTLLFYTTHTHRYDKCLSIVCFHQQSGLVSLCPSIYCNLNIWNDLSFAEFMKISKILQVIIIHLINAGVVSFCKNIINQFPIILIFSLYM